MMIVVAQIIGFAGVGLFLLSYQLKKRQQIVWVSFFSNVFYVLQYLLLGAFSGAIMDTLATVASFFAAKKNAPHLKKHTKQLAFLSVLMIAVIGIAIAMIRKDFIELLPIVGGIFQTLGLWCDDEQLIRKLGLCGAPFWLVYNFISQAYGATLGSVLAIISIIVSLVRYRKK